MSQLNTKFKEPLAPTLSWQLPVGNTTGGDFSWIQVIYDETTITTPVTVCVKGYSNQGDTISPVVFTQSGQWRPIIGHEIKASGNDIIGNSHTATTNVTVYAFRGL